MNARISEFPAPLRWALLAALALGAVACLERGGTEQRGWRAYPPPLDRPLPAGVDWFSLSAALGDAARPAADVDYIACLQYMGGRNAYDGFYGQTLPLYARVQWLDPSFRHAVVEGVSVLGWLYRRPEQAEVLDRAALAADPGEPRYGVFLAALAYQKRLDPSGVLRALAPVIVRTDAPEMLLRAYGNLVLKQGDARRSRTYWLWVLGRDHDGETRSMALRTLKRLGVPAASLPPS